MTEHIEIVIMKAPSSEEVSEELARRTNSGWQLEEVELRFHKAPEPFAIAL
jgi:hypothetical protein